MRQTIRFILIIAILGAFLQLPASAAQSSSADVSKKAEDAWDKIKAYTVEKKQEAVDYGHTLLRDADSKISDLKHKSAEASAEGKAKYEKAINELKPARERAGAKFEEMKAATKSTWETTKQGFAKAYKDLQQTYNKAVERL